MTDAASILVIILSVVLAIFLILAIVLVIMLIGISSKIKRITSSVQATTENIESVMRGVGKVTSPLLIAKMLMKQFNKAAKRKDK